MAMRKTFEDYGIVKVNLKNELISSWRIFSAENYGKTIVIELNLIEPIRKILFLKSVKLFHLIISKRPGIARLGGIQNQNYSAINAFYCY